MSRVALTYRDYAALPDDGRRYQILNGELFVTPAPTTRHQIISMRLSAQLHAHASAHGRSLRADCAADRRRDARRRALLGTDAHRHLASNVRRR
jgi:hypothetical protein